MGRDVVLVGCGVVAGQVRVGNDEGIVVGECECRFERTGTRFCFRLCAGDDRAVVYRLDGGSGGGLGLLASDGFVKFIGVRRRC